MSYEESLDLLIADLLTLNKYVPPGNKLFDYLLNNAESVAPNVFRQIINDVKKIIKKYGTKAEKVYKLKHEREHSPKLRLSQIISELKSLIAISINPNNNTVIPLSELMSDEDEMTKNSLMDIFRNISNIINSEQSVKDYNILIRNNMNLPASIVKEIVEFSHGEHNNDSRYRASDRNLESLIAVRNSRRGGKSKKNKSIKRHTNKFRRK